MTFGRREGSKSFGPAATFRTTSASSLLKRSEQGRCPKQDPRKCPSCSKGSQATRLAPSRSNIRHDEAGDRTVTREVYAAEIAKIREERPDIRVVVYDHSFKGNRAWFRAGMQSHRIETGKLVETWLILKPLGSAWPDAIAQKHWTSPPPIK
jgi:hypothetical protein